jgi:NhaP-type Na+/H+ or K+/H+ antiporter
VRVMRVAAALSVALFLHVVGAQHSDTVQTKVTVNSHGKMVPSDGVEHSLQTYRGGHVSKRLAGEPCKPVICAGHEEGCRPITITNFMKGNVEEQVNITCQGCVPHTCSHGEHDCNPVFCDIGARLHGGHKSNPCEQGHHDGDGLGWWPFLLLCLLLSVLTTGSLKKLSNGACCGKSISLPYTVVMFFIGYIISSIVVKENVLTEKLVDHANKQEFLQSEILFDSVLAWKSAHPHVILFVLLPPLLFEDAASMDYYVFRKVLMSSILLAGPGVLLTMFLCAATTMLLFGFASECITVEDHVTHEKIEECGDQLPVSVHLLLGGMLAATDPVAVCAVLNDLGCPDKLNYMIAGESLLNDGTAVVAFLVMQSVAGGCDTTAAKVSIALVRLAGGGVLWGMFMAACAYQSVKHIRDPNVEITITVFCTFTTFWMAENIIGVSGVLGTVVFGVQTARTTLLAMDEHTAHASHAFWSEVGYVATSIIFILAGVKSRDKIARFIDEVADNHFGDGADTDEEFSVSHQMLFCFILWIALGIIRALVVLAFSPILKQIGYGLTWKEAAVMVWGGLRGAVSLSLALLVDGNHLIGDRAREMIFLQTTGIVTLTLVINGTTAGAVYKALQVYPPNKFRPVLVTQGLRNLQLEMDKCIASFSQHWFHGQADLPTLLRIFPDFSEAHLFDGDLVDVQLDDMHDAWVNGLLSEDTTASPVRVGIKVAELMKSGVRGATHTLRTGYNATERAEGDVDSLAPDVYCEVIVQKGAYYESFDSKVLPHTRDPVWKTGRIDETPNSFRFFVPQDTPDETLLHIHVYNNALGGVDAYLGEAKMFLDTILEKNSAIPTEKQIELTPCTHQFKLLHSASKLPTKVSGTISVKVEVNGPSLTINLMNGKGIGEVATEDTEQHAGHDATGHHESHGHGTDHAAMLRNTKRWIEQAAGEVDSESAMYEILLTAMKTQFIHDRESKLLSVKAYTNLNSAIGLGYDLNQAKMDNQMKMQAMGCVVVSSVTQLQKCLVKL